MSTRRPTLVLDPFEGDLPLPARIAAAVRHAVAAGRLLPGDALPSSRALAAQLGVSRGSVTRAFDQLAAELYVLATPGSYTRINPDLSPPSPTGPAPRPSTPERPTREPGIAFDLRPGARAASPPDDPGWRAAWRRASAPGGAAPAPPQGDPLLREALAEHLRLLRSHVVDPRRLLITAGAREGLDLVLTLLAERDGKRPRVGVEDPGFPGLRRVLDRRGQAVPSPVDEAGVRLEALDPGLDALLLTPNHLYPLGEAMPATRRSALLGWAAERGTLLIEDDYDSEFRYLGPPLPSLASVAGIDTRARVAQLGTFSHLLVRDAALGYLLLPPDLMDEALALRRDLGLPVSAIAQRAMADFLGRGGLRRHIARSRRRLQRRRARLLEVLGDAGARSTAGAHALLPMADTESARDAVARLRGEGIAVGGSQGYWSGGAAGEPGLVFSYDSVGEADLDGVLAAILRAVTTARSEHG